MNKINDIILEILEGQNQANGLGYQAFYQPAYDSPIEDSFAWHCTKYLRAGLAFDTQVELNTRHGRFRMDFLLADAHEKVAVECDGHDFHEPFRDEFRDAILLSEGNLDTVYHFRGCDITYYPIDCIWLMAFLNPRLFSERGRLNLNQLHKLEIVDSLTSSESYMLRGRTGEQPYWFWAFRRTIHLKPRVNPHWPHWKVLYEFACAHPGVSLDNLVNMRFGRNL